MTQLSLESVSARVAGVSVLESVSFAVEPGETVAVIGPRGCGKKSLLRVVAGQVPTDSGRIVLNGRDITDRAPGQRCLAVVGRRDAAPPADSVAEHVSGGMKSEHALGDGVPARTRALLELMELDRYAALPLASLNDEQYRRVALARALASEPEVLLLDECADLQCVNARARWRTLFREVRRHLRQTTLMVTTDSESALSMADRLVVMNAGQVRQSGPATDIYNYPSDAFVACSVGRCNLVPGEYNGDGRFRSSSGLDLPCAHVNTQPGRPAVLAIRPENVELGPPMGGLKARVTDITFLGSQIEYGLDLHGHALSAVASTRASGVPVLQPGALVDLAWALHAAQPLSA